MESKQEQVTTGSSQHTVAMAARTLYPLAPLAATFGAGPGGRIPAWMAAAATGSDAAIIVWWDYPPS